MRALRLLLLGVLSARVALGAADIDSAATVDFALGCYQAVGIDKDDLKDTAGNATGSANQDSPHKEGNMTVTAPTPDQLKQIASEMGLSLTESDVASFMSSPFEA